jgi:archaellum biogenesis protein FlaJ (TadC family)
MKLKKMHWTGIIFGSLLLAIDFIFFLGEVIFFFIFGIVIFLIVLPFIAGLIIENTREKEISLMFLEFSRNLAESVTTGTPISKSIVNMKGKNYGVLSPYIFKLSNQIEIGIPVNKALENFAFQIGSPTIQRAVALIREAERAGGEIDYILDSVAQSISDVEKLKEERKASIYNLVVQGYIIFSIFIGIMLVMEFKILPLVEDIGSLGSLSGASLTAIGDPNVGGGGGTDSGNLATPFLILLLAQGFFAGLTIGKLTEGKVVSGLKHSFALTMAALLISTGVRAFVG